MNEAIDKATAKGKRKSRAKREMPRQFEQLFAVRLYRLADELAQLSKLVFEARYGVRFTDVRILTQLGAQEKISIGEISRIARVDKAWISRLVRELEEKGLVERSLDPKDSRVTLLALTVTGHELQGEMLAISRQHDVAMMAGIDEEQFATSLLQFHENIDSLRKAVLGSHEP